MERAIEKVEFTIPQIPKAERVAAYARVSSGKDAMLHSLAAQVSYYSDLIENHPGWLFAGVYADEAISGTKDSRGEFQRLLADCRAGRIDRIITKSISRFARNTVTLLETIRELRQLGIDVFFEEQNIHTLSADGELVITILASYAQEESRSVSENQIWRVRRNFEQGKPWNTTMLGYRAKEGTLYVFEPEAETVRRIFREYLSGKGLTAIANGLNRDGITTRNGSQWHKTPVQKVLKNYAYTGNLLLQQTFRESFITKKQIPNEGQLPKYHAVGTHEAIIDLETYERVQDEMQRRADKKKPRSKEIEVYPFTSKIICAHCGKHYGRKTTPTGPVWICATYNTVGKAACPSKAIPESVLLKLTEGISFDEIIADNNNTIRVRSGSTETVLTWKDRSRSESWTPEMKAAAAERTRQRSAKKCQGQ